MKKWMAVLLVFVCIATLFGCNKTDNVDKEPETTDNAPQRYTGTYQFYGENEYLKITNGSIDFKETNESFYGGDLEVLQSDLFVDLRSYSTSFFTLLSNDQRNNFHSTIASGVRDGANDISGDLGSSSSNGFMVVYLEHGLWFELITTDVNGNKNVYLLELTVVKDTN